MFFKVRFLEVLKTMSICIKFRKKSWKLPMNDFIFMKVTGIQLIRLLKHFSFYYYHNWRYNNCHRAPYISLWLHSVKYNKIPEDLENINVEENKYQSWGRSKTASLFYILGYLFALDKRKGNKSFRRGVPRTVAKAKMELFGRKGGLITWEGGS